jgi:isopenicillin-N N-acyltransferase like protein
MPLLALNLSGTPTEMGRQHGEELREQVQAMCRTRLDLAARAAAKLAPPRDLDWCLGMAAECVQPVADYAPDVFAEWAGVAAAAGLTVPEMVIGNGWTDYVDLLRQRGAAAAHGCTSVAFWGERAAGGLTYVAQTWDMSPSARPYLVLVRRRPSASPGSLCLTTAGCLSLIGMNEAGVAIGNTNLVPTDARPGVHYLALIHHALAQTTLDAAARAITEAPRLSGHYYYLGGPEGQFVGLETSGGTWEECATRDGWFVHTNHYLGKGMLGSALVTPAGDNSLARAERAAELALELPEPLGPRDILQILSDHRGEHPICRHTEDPADAASLAAVVQCPQQRKLWVAAGNPCVSEAEEYNV